MNTTAEDLATKVAEYVGGVTTSSYLDDCVSVATCAVGRYTRGETIPDPVRERAIIEVAAELYHRKSAPNGVKLYADLDGATTIRVARDAMVAARPLLAPYLTPGIA